MFVSKLVCICFVVTLVLSDMTTDRVSWIYRKCQIETKLSKNEMVEFLMTGWYQLRSPLYQCMMGCLMKETNVIVDGHSVPTNLFLVVDSYYTTNHKMAEHARGIVKDCTKVKQTGDDCSLARRVVSCIRDKARWKGLRLLPRF